MLDAPLYSLSPEVCLLQAVDEILWRWTHEHDYAENCQPQSEERCVVVVQCA